MFIRIVILFILISKLTFAQDLYVDDDSYLYAKNVVVFVNNDIQLETPTSNLYFRGNAQLIQNADIKNSDAGELSIYQNQTVGIYEYNYFCSPVGISVNGAARANVPFNGTNIHDPFATDLPLDNTELANIVSSDYLYTTAYDGTATELSNYWLYTLKDGEGYWSWNQIFDTGTVETGYGFTLKGSPNANNVLDFRGRPNNGTILVSCAFDGTDDQPASGTLNTAETLTGNPYPSTLDLKLFFVNSATNQSRLSGALFFWEQAATGSHYLADYEGGYATYTPGDLTDLNDNGTYTVAPFEFYNGNGGGVGGSTNVGTNFGPNNSRRYAAVGQGFVIQSVGAGGDATFDNSMRLTYIPEDSNTAGNGAVFAKDGKTKEKKSKSFVLESHNGVDYKSIIEKPTVIPEIRIHTQINNTFYKENVIAFRSGTPDNNTYNKFFDGASINELSDDAVIISGGKALSVKSINYNENTRLALALKASNDNTPFSIGVHSLEDVSETVNIYVFDTSDNSYTNIKDGTFNITLDAGEHNNRFEITFKNNALLDTDHTTLNDFDVFQLNNIASLKLHNPNQLIIESINVFDVAGKQVLKTQISSSESQQSYSTKSLSDGVYVVKITFENQQAFSKKVMINNKK